MAVAIRTRWLPRGAPHRAREWIDLLTETNWARGDPLGPALRGVLDNIVVVAGEAAFLGALDHGTPGEVYAALRDLPGADALTERLGVSVAAKVFSISRSCAAKQWRPFESVDRRIRLPIRVFWMRTIQDNWDVLPRVAGPDSEGQDGEDDDGVDAVVDEYTAPMRVDGDEDQDAARFSGYRMIMPTPQQIVDAVLRNPYLLAQILPSETKLELGGNTPAGIHRWLTLLRRLDRKVASGAEERADLRLALGALVACVSVATRSRGHTRMVFWEEDTTHPEVEVDKDKGFGRGIVPVGSRALSIVRRLGVQNADRKLILEAADILMSRSDTKREVLYPESVRLYSLEGTRYIFPEAASFCETEIAKLIQDKLINEDMDPYRLPDDWDERLEELCPEEFKDASQRMALRAAWTQPVTFVTGAAGTGKTGVLVALKRMWDGYHEGDIRFTATAFTGKAVHNLDERFASRGLGVDVMTIHRKLGLFSQTKHVNRGALALYAGGFVLVDEMSMIHSVLLGKLAIALSGVPCRLVLAGDLNQLQPVGAGQPAKDVLRTLTQPQVQRCLRYAPVATLTENHRQVGRQIASVAAAVAQGRWPGYAPPEVRFVRAETREETAAAVLREVETAVGAKRSWQVIAFRRKDVDMLNARLREGLNPGSSGAFSRDDKILQFRNNYDDIAGTLFNGDPGTVRRVDDDDVVATFTRRVVDEERNVVTVEELHWRDVAAAPSEWAQAWALTVHKYQGSEADVIIFAEPPAESQGEDEQDEDILDFETPNNGLGKPIRRRQLYRSIWYTALTRARMEAIVVAPNPEELADQATKNSDPVRFTALYGRLHFRITGNRPVRRMRGRDSGV